MTIKQFIPLSGSHWRRSLRGLIAPLESVVAFAHPGRPGRKLAGLGLSVPIFLLSALIWFLVWRIATYGFFWGRGDPEESWGGPTLIGAWAVHALIALAMVVAAMWALTPLTARHRHLSGVREARPEPAF